MKVVINKCYGGFSISTAGLALMCEMGNALAIKEMEEWKANPDRTLDSLSGPRGTHYIFDLPRNDPHLVAMVERLGEEESGGAHASLRVVEIPDGVEWEIDEYDGMERVAETHRTWG